MNRKNSSDAVPSGPADCRCTVTPQRSYTRLHHDGGDKNSSASDGSRSAAYASRTGRPSGRDQAQVRPLSLTYSRRTIRLLPARTRTGSTLIDGHGRSGASTHPQAESDTPSLPTSRTDRPIKTRRTTGTAARLDRLAKPVTRKFYIRRFRYEEPHLGFSFQSHFIAYLPDGPTDTDLCSCTSIHPLGDGWYHLHDWAD